jgi:oxygen-independent coproporphyrinogen III oxidase
MKRNKPTGIYIHIPFCQKKCSYCDFASIPRMQWDESITRRYVDSLKIEIQRTTGRFRENLVIDTVFIGGGTPSVIDPCLIGEILDTLKKDLHFQTDPEVSEVSIEVNPGTVDAEKFRQYVDSGINRVSIGAQSLDDNNLKLLGRIHDRKTIMDTLQSAGKAGFKSVSLDFIYGLPGQTPEKWKNELKEIVELKPNHLSLYCLTPEAGTLLGDQITARCVCQPTDEEQVEMMEINHQILTKAGYTHYEISNYALPGHESRHNLKYWRSEDYLGFGSSSFSYLNRRRWSNVDDPFLYMERLEADKSVVSFSERLPVEKQMGEYIMMGLRLAEGISSEKFKKRFESDITEVYPGEIAELTRRGWLKQKEGETPGDTRFYVPPEYFSIQNEIAGYFIS